VSVNRSRSGRSKVSRKKGGKKGKVNNGKEGKNWVPNISLSTEGRGREKEKWEHFEASREEKEKVVEKEQRDSELSKGA